MSRLRNNTVDELHNAYESLMVYLKTPLYPRIFLSTAVEFLFTAVDVKLAIVFVFNEYLFPSESSTDLHFRSLSLAKITTKVI